MARRVNKRSLTKADAAYCEAMGVGKPAEDQPLAQPPSSFQRAAADHTAMWVLDVNGPEGRRIFLEPLAAIEARLDVFDGVPDTVMFLCPAETAWQRHKYGQLAKRGWFRGGWYCPPTEYRHGVVDAALEAQVDEWRRQATQ